MTCLCESGLAMGMRRTRSLAIGVWHYFALLVLNLESTSHQIGRRTLIGECAQYPTAFWVLAFATPGDWPLVFQALWQAGTPRKLRSGQASPTILYAWARTPLGQCGKLEHIAIYILAHTWATFRPGWLLEWTANKHISADAFLRHACVGLRLTYVAFI